MKIALVAPPWVAVPPIAYGGTEAVVDRLARGFVREGHEVTLITTGDSTCPVNKRWVFDVAQTDRMGTVSVELRHVLFAYEHVQDADIVHDHSLIGPVHAATAGFDNVVTTNHGPFDPESSDTYRHIADRIPILAISHHQASTATGIRIARVIHHGIDNEKFPLGQGDGGYLLFLGRMSPDKGAHRAIRIAREAGVPLIIAGKLREAGEHHYFNALIAPHLGPDVSYVGEANEPQKIELLSRALALINPIKWPEPFGLVMIESLACGTPVLTFPEGAAPEIVDDGSTGFLCKSDEDMVEAVARIPSLDRQLCQKVAGERFSTERMVRDHLQLYDDVLAKRLPR
jgi:glycosyltransferase involved in cell wall biosynthesis